MPTLSHQVPLPTEEQQILLSKFLDATTLSSTQFGNSFWAKMAIKTYDMSKAVHYHAGRFPPGRLDYELILPALNNAAA